MSDDKADMLTIGSGVALAALLLIAWWMGYVPVLDDVLRFLIESVAVARS